jgi:hypothetical protein
MKLILISEFIIETLEQKNEIVHNYSHSDDGNTNDQITMPDRV